MVYLYSTKRRIIVISTLRQLGLITISIGLSGLAFLHLLTHALFKGYLFMCAGRCYSFYGGSQVIRFMGGLSVYIPFTSSSLIVSNFALCGMPKSMPTLHAQLLFSPKSCRLWDKVAKHFTAVQTTDDNVAHANCALDNYGYKHILRICNTYYLSTTTMVARMNPIVNFTCTACLLLGYIAGF